MTLTERYGTLALVAGASEGIGAAFSRYLAKSGMDLVLVARRKEPLEQFASTLANKYNVGITCINCDLADSNAVYTIKEGLKGREINLMVYNAALSHIGPFEQNSVEDNTGIAIANMITPLNMLKIFGEPMLKMGKGGIIMMASLAGFQGSGFLSVYAASKAYTRVLAESLWYEWKNRGVDVIACCAGATSTPNFIKTNPEDQGFLAPRVLTPEEVVKECICRLGKKPSFVAGRGNRFASFIMQRLMPRMMAINIMGDMTRKIYRL
jgi:uncharacterized protein